MRSQIFAFRRTPARPSSAPATARPRQPRNHSSHGVISVPARLALLQLFEGKLESVNIVSNRFFSSNNILGALPSLATNILINTKWLQPELDRANLNPDRQI